MQNNNNKKMKTIDLVLCAIFAALMIVFSYITIPLGPVPFTLQTFGVFIACGMLGGKRGTISVLVFILIYMILQGGPAVFLAKTTGGYVIGFLLSALLMWLIEYLTKNVEKKSVKNIIFIISMILGLIVCYVVGTIWFMNLYIKANGELALMTCLGWCVFPFIIPDLCKIALAYVLSLRLRRHIPQ